MKKKFKLSLEERLNKMDQLTRKSQMSFNGGNADNNGIITTEKPPVEPSFSFTPGISNPPVSITFSNNPIQFGGTIKI